MRTTLLLFCMLYVSAVLGQNPRSNEYYLLIGTYSNQDKTNGIHVYKFNTQTGEFSAAQSPTILSNASYLAVSHDKKNLYAVSEHGQDKASVHAYAFDPASGKLTFLNSVPSEGDHPCYVSVDSKKKFVFVGNYSGGNLISIPLKADGSFRADVQNIKHEGSSVNKERQEKPHVH